MTTPLLWLVAWVVVAVAAAISAPELEPADATVHPPLEALALGLLAGGTLFLALARRDAWPCFAQLTRRRLAARAVTLTAKSAQEEALWRALLLGLLVAPLGWVGALAASTVLFACAHVPRQGRRAVAHLATGATFGSVYLATGRLLAATAAHALYNILVGVSVHGPRGPSVSDTGNNRATAVPSRSLSRHRRSMREHDSTPGEASVARLESVSKSFGRVTALTEVDLELHPGEVLALLGPNGAGKSTAVSILLGLRRPDAGTAWLLGRDPRQASARRSVGAVLQEVGFPPVLRVRELAELVSRHYPDGRSVDDTLAHLGLAALTGRQALGLSGGQRRRLAVALALAGRPQVLFLDEPTAGMDAGARRSLLRDVATFADHGGAVLLTTQQLAEAEEIASRIVLLVDGRIALEGSVAAVRATGGATKIVLRAASLPPLPGVISIDSSGDRHVLLVDDADELVTHLVRAGVAFRDLEIVRTSLEDAFVALTSGESA